LWRNPEHFALARRLEGHQVRPLQGNCGAAEFVLHNQQGQADAPRRMPRRIKFSGIDRLDASGMGKFLEDGLNRH
jgi:hypothetical protein